MSFSEVGPKSFRTSWQIDAANVDSFLLRFKPESDDDGHYVSMSVSGDTQTALLPNLTPLTRYEVNVIAQYEKGESLPVTGYETTLEGMSQNIDMYVTKCRYVLTWDKVYRAVFIVLQAGMATNVIHVYHILHMNINIVAEKRSQLFAANS